MTIGVGGSTAEKELAAMRSMRGDVPPIGVEERLKRIARAQAIMREKGIDALHLDVASSMIYFTGLNFRRTERMHSAVLPATGDTCRPPSRSRSCARSAIRAASSRSTRRHRSSPSALNRYVIAHNSV